MQVYVSILKSLANLYYFCGICKDAVSDLSNAHEVSPDDETIANVLWYGFF